MKAFKKSRRLNQTGIIIFLLVATVVFYVNSCYRDYGLGIEDYDIAMTFYDKNISFASFQTYAIPDTVIHLVPEGKEDNLTREFDAQIISDIKRNMDAKGYQYIEELDTSNLPDIVMLVSATVTEWESWSYYPGWGGWWGWWGYPGWGWGYYPGYPGYITSQTFTTGTIIVEMLDPDKIIEEGDKTRVAVLWGGALNGLLSSNKPQTSARIRDGINRLFVQSPYLGR